MLLPKDYVRYRLTGTFATEVSDASGTLLLDVANRRWSRELLGKLDIDPALLPACHESPEVSAQVSELGSKATGLRGGHAGRRRRAATSRPGRSATASSARASCRRRWGPRESCSLMPMRSASTRWAGSSAAATPCRAPGTSWGSCWRPAAASSGSATSWARPRSRWPGRRARTPTSCSTDEAALAGPGAEGLFFLPYLTGERTPHFDPDAKGAWVGLTVRHGRAHLIRSLLEGATFAMRDSLELIREMGVTIEQVRVSGGGARNALWRQIQADIYGCDVHTLNSTEGPAFGVALLAQVGTGGFGSVPEACDATIRPVESTRADPKAKAYYDRALRIYRQLYYDLRGRSRRSVRWWHIRASTERPGSTCPQRAHHGPRVLCLPRPPVRDDPAHRRQSAVGVSPPDAPAADRVPDGARLVVDQAVGPPVKRQLGISQPPVERRDGRRPTLEDDNQRHARKCVVDRRLRSEVFQGPGECLTVPDEPPLQAGEISVFEGRARRIGVVAIIVDRLRDLEQRRVGVLSPPGFPVCPDRWDLCQRLARQGPVDGLTHDLGPLAAGLGVLHHHVFAVKLAGNEEGQGLTVDPSVVNERRLAQAAPGDGNRLAAQDVVNHMMVRSGKHVDRVSTRLALDLDSDHVILIVHIQTGVRSARNGHIDQRWTRRRPPRR